MAYMPATSNEELLVHWGADAVGLPVQIAIIPAQTPEVEPADADYKAASWDGTTGSCMLPVGDGTDMPLQPGEYVVWSRLTVGSRRPVRRSGTLTVGVPA